MRTFFCYLKGALAVHGGQISYRSQGQPQEIQINDIEMNVSGEPRLFHLTSAVVQGSERGHIRLSGTLGKDHLEAEADIEKLPTLLLDQLESSRLISAALGPFLDLKLTLEQQEGNYYLKSDFTSANLREKSSVSRRRLASPLAKRAA